MAHSTTKTIVGVYSNQSTAERAVQELVNAGFQRSEIDITSNDSIASYAARGNTGLSGDVPTGEGAGGSIGRFFRNLFGTDVNDEESTTYANAVQRGHVVVTVRADDHRSEEALDILERYDPIDVDQQSSSSRLASTSNMNTVDTEGERSVPVVEEELRVGKRAVQRGGMRIYSRIIEQPVEEQISLREEHVNVQRRSVDRPATEADFRPSEQVIEVTETVEEPVISKQARVREEVVIGKEATTRTETVHDTVRRTDVSVEEVGGNRATGYDTSYDTEFQQDFRTRYGSLSGATYEQYAPAYQYGSRMAADPRYRGKNWEDVQDTLETDYMRNNPHSKWEQAKGAVRYGWEKMTGKRS